MRKTKRCKIALLDSGIDSFFLNDESIISGNTLLDDNGHGSMCYSTIKRFAPNAEFLIYKILDYNLATSSQKLINTLETIYNDGNADIVHMSLSTSECALRGQMEDICKRIRKKGCLIVASNDNREQIQSFPCSFPDVIGVSGGIYKSDFTFEYYPNREVQVVANKVPSLTRSIDGEYRFFGGTSKAAACMTGIIASNWNQFVDEEFDNYMEQLSLKSMSKQELIPRREVTNYIEDKWEWLIQDDLQENKICDFLREFENELGIKVKFEDILLLDFSDKKTLSVKLSNCMVENNGKEDIT